MTDELVLWPTTSGRGPRRTSSGSVRCRGNGSLPSFESHEHYRLVGLPSGPNVQHSHADGSDPHRHPDHGPANFRGNKPRRSADGPQMAYEPTEPTFRVIVHEASLQRFHAARAANGESPVRGGADLTVKRMEDVFHLRAVYERGDA